MVSCHKNAVHCIQHLKTQCVKNEHDEYRARSYLEFQLDLWASSSQLLLPWRDFLLVLVNDLPVVRR